ncbi:hypothetical protein ACFYXF_03255 [Streptomyces sp. NPDC002680]|uniref:hypothetical protein n=1 Tax=Streptomyces sp. NPDC002680 TaxID=3364659 RepID=UPI003695E63C
MPASAPPASLQVGAAHSLPESGSGARPAPAAVLLGFFTIMFDAMIVNVALPSIGSGFGSGMPGVPADRAGFVSGLLRPRVPRQLHQLPAT